MPIVLTNTMDCYCKEEFKYVHINKSYKGSEYFYNKMSKCILNLLLKYKGLKLLTYLIVVGRFECIVDANGK